jgi:hypothetical protein
MIDQWWKLSSDLAFAGMEAQRVVALRLAKIAKGGPAAERESRRMVAEKIGASAEAAVALASGRSPQSIVRRYRTIMRANEKRLRAGR